MIIIKIFLHGKPDWYLPLQGVDRVNHYVIRLYADQLKDHLYNVAEIVRRLQENEWCLLKSYGTVYYLEYCKFDLKLEDAKKELQILGVNNDIIIEELDLENVH